MVDNRVYQSDPVEGVTLGRGVNLLCRYRCLHQSEADKFVGITGTFEAAKSGSRDVVARDDRVVSDGHVEQVSTCGFCSDVTRWS